MAEIISVLTVCDVHIGRGDKQIEAKHTKVEIKLNKSQIPKWLDLCDECFDQYVIPLEDIVSKYGKGKSRNRRQAKVVTKS